ncbi:MAG TPA: tetratricopeptide repeat protein [Burkholderiales bacterium]|nr:tetratricopeptide repeat protein [Burkholderiales bacterium]
MLKNLLRSLRPRRAARLNEEGLALWQGGDLAGAERAFRAAIDARPGFAPAFGNLGMVVWEQRRLDEGLALLTRAVELDPRHLNARLNLGNVLAMAGRREESVAHYREVLRADPGHAEARANLLRPLMDLCEWAAVAAEVRPIAERWEREGAGAWLDCVTPYLSLLLPVPPAFRLAVAKHHAERIVARAGRPVRATPRARGKRLRIGYASADFQDHAVAHLTVGLFERHDRERFELCGYSFGHDDGSAYRRRIAAACDRFVDLRDASFRAAAERIAADGVDVLVDLMGHTGGSRPEVFALRPAPVQATWLGYPGTTGGRYMDYLIADRIVLPEGDLAWCSEAVAWLPDCYMPTDDAQLIAARVPSRAECGLPERGVVFCAFNQTAKIDAGIFATWLRVLAAVPDAVLWLSGASAGARRNLEQAAARAGVAPARLVFAAHVAAKAEHLARHRVADLFLDTHLYNAHTTACDALWAGLPVLTCPAPAFPGRVATSLLQAVGLPELSVATLADYERTAIDLARAPERREELKARLARSRRATPLFDTPRFARGLEQVYEAMWVRHERGEPPARIGVP